MYSTFHAIFGLINLILSSPAFLDSIHYVSFNSRCVKVNFAGFCSLIVDINHSECHSAYVKLKFANAYSLILDAFLLPCHSRSLNSMLWVFRA